MACQVTPPKNENVSSTQRFRGGPERVQAKIRYLPATCPCLLEIPGDLPKDGIVPVFSAACAIMLVVI